MKYPDVDSVIAGLNLKQKIAQLGSLWIGVAEEEGDVAPAQSDNIGPDRPFSEVAAEGLGQITRLYGTRPVEAPKGKRTLRSLQNELLQNAPQAIGAIVHEECLTGVNTYGATTYPSPLNYGATWDPELVEETGRRIGRALRALDIHQGLAPVMDVARDARWGRVEETFGEDPYVVGTLGAAYIRGIESADVISTPKHFVGYSGSVAGRNHAPVMLGVRDLKEIFLYPFEIAMKEGKPRSIMPSYAEIDQVPSHSDQGLLTELLRNEWGFEGSVVSDYFGVNFLHSMHGIAGDKAQAAAQALSAGVDVELPATFAFAHLEEAVERGIVSEDVIDRSLKIVLDQKAHFGLLDSARKAADVHEEVAIDLDSPAERDLARRLAENSIVLLSNDGDSGVSLPLAPTSRIALIGPNAQSIRTLLGDYSFTNHVEVHHPEIPPGLNIATIHDALMLEFGPEQVAYARGCDVRDARDVDIDEALKVALAADVVVVSVGDQSGLFGNGTVGEGCDTDSLELPGSQRDLLEAMLQCGKPVVVVLTIGRPYNLEFLVGRAAAIVQAGFPGQEGAAAIAGVLSGRLNPQGRSTLSFPTSSGSQPSTYYRRKLAGPSGVTALSPRFVFPFGHGLSYSAFEYSQAQLSAESVALGGTFTLGLVVWNVSDRDGADVVQLYLQNQVVGTTRPERILLGYQKVSLAAGQRAFVEFRIHTDRLSFVGRSGGWENRAHSGEFVIARSAEDTGEVLEYSVTGPTQQLGFDRVLTTDSAVQFL